MARVLVTRVLVPCAVVALAACGGLSTPELGSGALAGRLQNATAAAYVYPYGRPDLRVEPAADGTWALPRVPVETRAVVVVDGAPGSWRAALVPVALSSATLAQAPSVDAAAMPLAGRVGVVARLAGGCESTTTRFTAAGTDREDVPAAAPGTATVLDPLPAGTFELVATASGFSPVRATVRVVASATTAQDIYLTVDARERTPGCTAAGASCRPGFTCDRASGACFECLVDADCAASATGRTTCVNRACAAPAAGAGTLCDGCHADSECASGVCAEGVCSRGCATSAECPAAFVCALVGGRGACVAPDGCSEAKEEFGSPCFYDAGCEDDLARALCVDARPAEGIPGYCSGPCDPARADDCAVAPGFACNPATRRCER